MPETTFTGPDLTTFLGLDALGLTAVGQHLTAKHAVIEWGLRALALECMSVSRVAAALGISWHTANNAILTSAQATLLDDPHRFDGVEVLGVDDSPARFALVREVPSLCGATPGGATAMSPSSST